MKTIRTGLVWLCLCIPVALYAQQTAVQITTPDNLTLAGTYYNPGQPGPGILLLHQCNRDRTSWHPAAEALMEAGYHVLTFDFRGYGESEGENPPWSGMENAITRWRTVWGDDMERAYQFLRQQPGVNGSRIGAAGASCGVFMALELARRHPDAVQTVALLSGPTDDLTLRFLEETPTLSVYGAVSAEDGSLSSMRSIINATPHGDSRLITFRSAGHGTDMLAPKPELLPELVAWFQNHLPR